MNVRKLAEITGLSIATISRVVKGDPLVDSETRERVLHVLAQYPFYPDGKPKRRRTRNIFVFLSPVEVAEREYLFRADVSFFSRVFSGVRARLHEADATSGESYYLLVVTYRTGGIDAKLSELESLPYAGQIAGAFIIHSNKTDDVSIASYAGPLRLYALGRSPEEIDAASVACIYFDNRMVGRLAYEHLQRLGHSRILVLSGNPSYRYLELREAAFRDAQCSSIVIRNTTENTSSSAYKLLSEIIAEQQPFPYTAIYAATEIILKGMLELFADRSMAVPGDVSVVSTNDFLIAYQHDPPITAIRTPSYELGHIAATVALENVSFDFNSSVRYRLDVMLRDRGSVIPIDR